MAHRHFAAIPSSSDRFDRGTFCQTGSMSKLGRDIFAALMKGLGAVGTNCELNPRDIRGCLMDITGPKLDTASGNSNIL